MRRARGARRCGAVNAKEWPKLASALVDEEQLMTASATTDPRQVNIPDIRSQLRALWAAQAQKGEAVIRASTHNLVVFVADHAAAEQTTQRIIELTSDRP